MNGGVLGLVSLRDFTQNIPATPVDVLTESPYLNYTDGTTEVFTLGGSSFLLDTASYATIKDTVWSHHSGVLTEYKLEPDSGGVPKFRFKDGYSVIFSIDGYPVIIETEYACNVKSMFSYKDNNFYYCDSDILLVKDIYNIPADSTIAYKDGLNYNLRLSNLIFNPSDIAERNSGVYFDEANQLYLVRVFTNGKLSYEKGFKDKNVADTCLRKAVQLYG